MKSGTQVVREPQSEAIDADLPDGWIDCTLGDHVYIAGRIGWRGLKAEEYTPSGPILLSVPNLNYGDAVDFGKVNHISQIRYDESPEIKLKEGDTLLVKDGAGIGKLGYVERLPSEATVNSSLLVVRPQSDLLTSKYLFYYLKGPTFQGLANQRITGSSTPHLFQKDIKRLGILAPPPNEQRRIVHKVESCLSSVVALRDHLSNVPLILKRFRQAVLAAAFSGKLTEDWREQQAQPTDIVDQQLAGLRRKRRQLINKKDAKEPWSPNPDFHFDSPESWRTVSIDELSIRITSGSRDWKRYYRGDGAATFIMAQNVRPLFFDRSFRLAVAPPQNDRDRERSQVNEDDLLVTIVGANTGDVCRVPEPVHEHYVCQSVALMRPVSGHLSAYLELYLNSPAHGQAQFKDWIYGDGRPHLSFDQLRQTSVTLPSVGEQQEIVNRVNALFRLADLIEERLKKAHKRADKLTQSILAKAFRGELVPTEAELARCEGREYEAASALLERIKKERAETSKQAMRHADVQCHSRHRRR